VQPPRVRGASASALPQLASTNVEGNLHTLPRCLTADRSRCHRGARITALAVWVWALACALSFALAAPFVFRAGRCGTPRAVLARIFLVLDYLVLAVLLLAEIFVQGWSDPTVRFTRGCVAGLGTGAILGTLGMVARRAPGRQSR
jgi:hypothetical protein